MALRDAITGLIIATFAVLVGVTVFVCINFGNVLFLVNHAIPVVDSGCSNEPLNTCKYGLKSAALQGSQLVNHCDTKQRVVGDSCTSACFNTSVDGTLTCDETATCVSDTPAKCLGYCNLTAGSPDTGGAATAHPDCADKITFKPFYYWNSTGSSNNAVYWLAYSDLAADCLFDVCVWYATAITFYLDPSLNDGSWTVSDLVSDFANDNPLYFLNVTNPECIHAFVHKVDTNFSTVIARGLNIGIATPGLAQATLIQYEYKCAHYNEDLMEDPDYTQKRGLSAPAFDVNEKFASMLSGNNVAAIKKLVDNPRAPHPGMMKRVMRAQ
jgi:hypothetical protein